MNNQKLFEFSRSNLTAREHLRKCRKQLKLMIHDNNENQYMDKPMLASLETAVNIALLINADIRDAIKLERVKNDDLPISDIKGGNGENPQKWNSSFVIDDDTTLADMEEQYNTKVLIKYQ